MCLAGASKLRPVSRDNPFAEPKPTGWFTLWEGVKQVPCFPLLPALSEFLRPPEFALAQLTADNTQALFYAAPGKTRWRQISMDEHLMITTGMTPEQWKCWSNGSTEILEMATTGADVGSW